MSSTRPASIPVARPVPRGRGAAPMGGPRRRRSATRESLLPEPRPVTDDGHVGCSGDRHRTHAARALDARALRAHVGEPHLAPLRRLRGSRADPEAAHAVPGGAREGAGRDADGGQGDVDRAGDRVVRGGRGAGRVQHRAECPQATLRAGTRAAHLPASRRGEDSRKVEVARQDARVGARLLGPATGGGGVPTGVGRGCG